MVRSRKSSAIKEVAKMNSNNHSNKIQHTINDLPSPSSSSAFDKNLPNKKQDGYEDEIEDEECQSQRATLLPSTSQRPTPTLVDSGPCPTAVFLISCMLVLGLFLIFFLLAPWFGSFTKNAIPISSFSPSNNSTLHFIKPSGPPGSITDKTENWAAQGGNWNNLDLEADNKAIENDAPFSNGTHKFKKTVLLISLDGFRADYLNRNLTPNLVSIHDSSGGIKSKFLQPQFPTLTFPNHWSILTGLYPESHGIVANDFRDPVLGKSFSSIDPHKSWDPHWWLGEPIWATAVKQGIRTAISMWPGPPYTRDKTRPTYWRAFEDHFKWWKKIQQLENWLDLPVKDRPQLIALYLPDVDQMGHHYGPDDPHLNKTIANIDRFVGSLHDVLKQRNLLDIIEVIYVSDHGMMATSDSRIVYLDEILGDQYFKQIQYQDGWPSAGLRFPDGVDTKPILDKLLEAEKNHAGFRVYTHETMPPRWHFTNSPRIAPIYVMPNLGWVISSKNEHQVVMNGTYNVKGVHGYDNEEATMRGIFVAHGPFIKSIKTQRLSKRRSLEGIKKMIDEEISTIEGFSNLEIYSLIAKLLNLEKFLAPNNCSKGFWDQYF
ncbi:hypothetical protein O181_077939 [Austropuccinia psidii MF-1]|uniref:Uncharacterized protein n=1 Tax=Austropuccinia psidii MF-1 TaxID=1389203 RepID=A0A9Q3IGU0_9BASI|nr:hypothetical protein [Austropuccinia psidii MF-1]